MLRTRSISFPSGLIAAGFAALLVAGSWATLLAQGGNFADAGEAREALERARQQASAAEARGERLEAEAREATQAAEKTAREAAALAARIQQSEAGIAAAEARLSLVGDQRDALSRRLAERREPLIRLTAALQKLARRPLALSVLRPGSLRETVYLRAMLDSTIPQVRERTAALRAEIERGRALEAEAQRTLAALRTSEAELGQRRTRLAAIESRQQLAARRASGDAARETDRALALAEQARDLSELADNLGAQGTLREELAALPGPIMRPPRPRQSEVIAEALPRSQSTGQPGARSSATARAAPDAAPPGFQLPVIGRTVSGFGEGGQGGMRKNGLTLAPSAGALVVSPAAGRVAFAGPYRGFGAIVIVEHQGGWTSLITGLARTDVAVGEQLLAGAPLGVAEAEAPEVMLELRRGGNPVNPLDFLR